MWIIFALILVGCEVSESAGPVDTGDFEAVLLEDGGPYACSNDSDTMPYSILVDPESDGDKTETAYEYDRVIAICSGGEMHVWCHAYPIENPGVCGGEFTTCDVYEGKWQCVGLCDVVYGRYDCSEFDTEN